MHRHAVTLCTYIQCMGTCWDPLSCGYSRKFAESGGTEIHAILCTRQMPEQLSYEAAGYKLHDIYMYSIYVYMYTKLEFAC